jgi:hypothetical protein
MELKYSPDIAKSAMENVLSGIEDADVYIDDVGAFSDNWDHHVDLIATILRRLRENGFTINPLKCEWAVKETDWLDYWLTSRGLKPWKKKIEAILHMDCPCNATELRMFIGCFNYYCDMWLSRAHILKPLTDQFGLKKKVLLNGLMTCNKHSTKCACLWLPMLLQLIRNTTNSSTYILMPLTSS